MCLEAASRGLSVVGLSRCVLSRVLISHSTVRGCLHALAKCVFLCELLLGLTRPWPRQTARRVARTTAPSIIGARRLRLRCLHLAVWSCVSCFWNDLASCPLFTTMHTTRRHTDATRSYPHLTPPTKSTNQHQACSQTSVDTRKRGRVLAVVPYRIAAPWVCVWVGVQQEQHPCLHACSRMLGHG
jgi:hypothetical protein